MKVAFTSITFLVFFMHFCKSKSIQSYQSVYAEGVNINPQAVHNTKESRQYYEYIVQYGEMRDKEWFKPALPTTKSGQKVKCAQWDEGFNHPHGSELEYEAFKDCLILKIETSNLNASSPVMVYIPGFDLSSGDVDSTSGHYLLDKDIVLVTVQYRLGVLGFLSTNTEEIPGNVGASDIILALKWIKNNIAKFGGNPNLVTLFGQYKAAGLIGLLTMSPLAENLFHQVIYQSGTAAMSNFTTMDPHQLVGLIASEIDCSHLETDSETETGNIDLNECLLHAKYGELLEAYRKVVEKNDDDIPLVVIGGLSGVLPGDEYILERLENKNFRPYPTMAGVVTHPAVLFLDHYNLKNHSTLSLEDLDISYKDLALKVNSLDSDEQNNVDVGEKELFETMMEITNTMFKGLLELFLPVQLDLIGMELKTDLLYFLLANKEAHVPVYMYAFKYQGTKHYFPKKQGTWLKNYVTLLDDNIYLFKPDEVISKQDEEIAEIMTDLWSSFAHKKVPDSDKMPVYWPQFNDTNGPYLIIDKDVTVGTNYETELTPLIDCANNTKCEWLEDKFAIDIK